jgi:hypothetical protein
MMPTKTSSSPSFTRQVLSVEDCEKVARLVYDLRSLWIPKGAFVPLFTLGATMYGDAYERGLAGYYAKARYLNPILWEQFSWLYEVVALGFQTMFGQKPIYKQPFALPGFHIFLPHSDSAASVGEVARAHVDSHYRNYVFDSRFDFSRPMAFTLPVEIPASGAGLDLWHLTEVDLIGSVKEERYRALMRNRPERIIYKLGEMVVHSGLTFHQIAPMEIGPDDKSRITLQGFSFDYLGQRVLYF